MPRFTQQITPDTLVASAKVHGGYRPFAARFVAGHGATTRSTLGIWLRMRFQMAVSQPLSPGRVSYTRKTRRSHFRALTACGRTDDESARREQ